MELTQEEWEELGAAAWNSGVTSENVRKYSGRGMYGYCLGFEHEDIEQLLAFVIEVTNSSLSNLGLEELATNIRQDSMGLGMITYWPNIKVSDINDDN